ncbi:PilZ domain-containing protein [Halobacillus campisalis]|uniref:PilZ domain-containing protein n=1 Tax=Halobacillus campisalis TaxID=435909 RepID=A0ABW2K560_9BACI|nr:PilZ domain-containing protein [Halobacillus campisalis]
MTLLVAYFIVINLLLTGLIIYLQKKSKAERKRIYSLLDEERNKLKKKQSEDKNRRGSFRLTLNRKDCTLVLKESTHGNMEKLKERSLKGYIENISASGVKFVCRYDLPVKFNFKVTSVFELRGEEFSLGADIVRKEEHTNHQLMIYGLQFVEMTAKDQERLSIVLHRIESENRKRIS